MLTDLHLQPSQQSHTTAPSTQPSVAPVMVIFHALLFNLNFFVGFVISIWPCVYSLYNETRQLVQRGRQVHNWVHLIQRGHSRRLAITKPPEIQWMIMVWCKGLNLVQVLPSMCHPKMLWLKQKIQLEERKEANTSDVLACISRFIYRSSTDNYVVCKLSVAFVFPYAIRRMLVCRTRNPVELSCKFYYVMC